MSSYIQTMSRQNYTAERLWLEINLRVNYSVKHVLREVDDANELNMDDPVTRHCVSTFGMACCNIEFQQMIPSWNAHTIPRRGIPNVLLK